MHISTIKLVKKYGWVTALDEVSLELEPGKIIAILGPNGAGKTTLNNALAGETFLDAGQVLFDKQLYTPERGDLRRRLAFIPDIPPVPMAWTPIRFISTALKLYEKPAQDLEIRVMELLTELDLLEVARWNFRKLSRGQIYKSVLAALMAADPEVWLVDEPFASGMDPRGLNCFKNYMRKAVTRGRTLIFTTQIIEVAEQFAHQICILAHGKIKAFAEPSKLRGESRLESILAQLCETNGPRK